MFYSCDDDSFVRTIDLDNFAFERKGVLYTELTNYDARDTVFNFRTENVPEITYSLNKVFISESQSLDSRFNGFSEAKVEFMSDLDTFTVPFFQKYLDSVNIGKLQDFNYFHYFKYKFQPGKRYKIKAQPLDKSLTWDSVEGEDLMPISVPFSVDDINLDYHSRRNDSIEGISFNPFGDFQVTIEDEKDRINLYEMEAILVLETPNGEKSKYNLMLSKYEDSEDDLFDLGSFENQFIEDVYLSNKGKYKFDYYIPDFDLFSEILAKGTKLYFYFRLNNYSDALVKFTKGREDAIRNEDNPLVEPPFIYTNIKNGLGVVGLKNKSYFDKVIVLE